MPYNALDRVRLKEDEGMLIAHTTYTVLVVERGAPNHEYFVWDENREVGERIDRDNLVIGNIVGKK
jgi:hypothetical protein